MGLKSYPIFDEEYRETLNQKILNRYMFNEIGFETPQRFIFELNTKMSIIMPYYNDLYNAYEELKTIGFKELIHESIGSDVTRTLGVGQQDNTKTTTGNVTDNEFGQVATTKVDYGKEVNYNYGKYTNTDYGKKTNYDYGKKTTTDYGRTTTNEQEKDSTGLNLNSDTPQSSINTSLKDLSNWNETPFVTDGNLNISNNGKTKTEDGGTDTVTESNGDVTTDSGGDVTHTSGGDNTTEGGEDNTEYKNNSHDTTNFNGNVNSDFTGNKSENEHIRTINFDYMKTYQQILDILTNIDTCILNDLRELFLYVY
jgi:hypothetical protein